MLITALTYNAHLFGQTAEYLVQGTRCETRFYFYDALRLPQIIASVRAIPADIVGFTEIWDDTARRTLESSLRDLYPYAAASPARAGIGRLLESTHAGWPRLAPRIEDAIGLLTSRHYAIPKTGLATRRGYVTEDRIARTLSAFLRSGPVWGAGLLFLSRYPIAQSFFLPHPKRADWEHLAEKGVLWNTVEIPDGRRFHVSLGHYQEGDSPEALAARDVQFAATRRTASFFGGPVIAMGDFNEPGGTARHAAMLSALDLFDAGLEPTYRDPNPYQTKLQSYRDRHARERRLDYILHGPEWGAEESAVPREIFRSSTEDYYLSDHDPVWMRLRLREAS